VHLLINLFIQIKMSSKLTTFVQVMDGTNYQQWAASMQAYLMSQNQWKCVKPGAVNPYTEYDKEDVLKITDQEKFDTWEGDAKKALGNLRLCLHHTIGYQYSSITDPNTLWNTLQEKYGSPGISAAFVHFKGAMETVIPNMADPSPALDKIMAHFTHLNEMKFNIPNGIQSMMLLCKAPTSMETVVQFFSQQTVENLQDKSKKFDLDPAKVVHSMRVSWDTTKREGGKGKQNQQHAKKLSAVHDGSDQPPSFQQQQHGEEGGQGQGRGGKNHRGNRGEQNKKQKQLQDAVC
jgi:hypothetical protein